MLHTADTTSKFWQWKWNYPGYDCQEYSYILMSVFFIDKFGSTPGRDVYGQKEHTPNLFKTLSHGKWNGDVRGTGIGRFAGFHPGTNRKSGSVQRDKESLKQKRETAKSDEPPTKKVKMWNGGPRIPYFRLGGRSIFWRMLAWDPL